MKVDDVNLQNYYNVMAEQQENGPAERGFVDYLFKLWKLMARIIRAKSEILATGQFSDYMHRFDDFIF